MKKIIFVSGIQIFPPQSGGQIRTANFCRSLVKSGFCVEIYSFTGRKNDYLNFNNSSEQLINDNLNEYTNRNIFFGIIQFITYHLRLPPFWLTLLTMFQTPSILKYKIKKSDLIIVDFPYLYPLAKHTQKPFYLNTHNAEFEIYNNFSLISNLVKKIELAGFDKSKKVFFCNTNDQRKYIKQLPDLLAKSFILPNGIDIFDFKHNDELRQKTRKLMKISDNTKVFLFTGSQYLPNKEALEFLIRWCEANQEEILKLNILVLVVGSVSEDLIDKNYIKVIGKVQNIVPYFSASDYGINPIITGSGTNVKMSEFMAAELPILTTVFGSRGFTLVDNQSCWFFERDQLLKTMKNVILQNSIHCKSMTSNAFIQNIEKIDMFRALNSLRIQW